MVLPLRSAGFSMPESSRTTSCMNPLPPNTATIFTGTPLPRTMIGPSATIPPSGALPAPTCLATSTPPRPTAKLTSRPAAVKYPLPWASWIGPKAGRIGGAGNRYVIFSRVCDDAGALSSPKPNALPPARSQRRDILASRADISPSPVGAFAPLAALIGGLSLPLYAMVSFCNTTAQARRGFGGRVSGNVGRGTARIPRRDDALRRRVWKSPHRGSGRELSRPRWRGGLPHRSQRLRQINSAQHRLGSLHAASEGEAFVDGERVEGPNAHVAFMLQKDLLLPWRTVLENVMFGVEIQRLALPERKQRAHALLENFNLAEFAGHYPHQLSGGMRQRVALARTLAVDPSVLLLDEPFSAVDAQTRMVLQRELAQTLKHAGKTALLITHDLLEAVTLSDRVLVMSRRPGRVIDEIRIELPQRDDPIARRQAPRVNEYVARLMDRLDISEAGQHPAGASA